MPVTEPSNTADSLLLELLGAGRIECHVRIASKKRLLERAGEWLADGLSSEGIFSALLERERLGSTGLGQGVALPHARLAQLEAPRAAFLQLNEAIGYDAIDDQPVDLVLALLVPEGATEQHLNLLASAVKKFEQADFRTALRNCQTAEEIMACFTTWTRDATPR